MDTVIENNMKSITLEYSAGLQDQVKKYANEKGITIEAAAVELMEDAIKSKGLSRGIVSGFSLEARNDLKNTHLEAIRQFRLEEAERLAALQNVPEEKEVENEGILFAANEELKALVTEINQVRVKRGLAPLEKSLGEIMYHWGENLGDYGSFVKSTGIDFSFFERKAKEIALVEREGNGVQSNLIETTGMLGKHTIVETE